MNDDRLGQAIGEFYRATDVIPPDSTESARQVATRLQRTPQVRRLPWQPWRRRGRASQDDTSRPTEYEPSPIPATNGHSTTVIGRTQIMFSPAKVIVAGALAFAIGGALYIAQPVEQPAIAPAAQGEPVAPALVTGSMQQVEDSCSERGLSINDGVSRHSYECTFSWTSSDPRLTGDASRPWNEDSYQMDKGPVSVSVIANYLKNDGGDWTCSTVSLVQGSSPTGESLTDGDTYLCIGGGGYEGLSAVLVSKYMADSFGDEFSGLIFSGDLPPLPEAPAAE